MSVSGTNLFAGTYTFARLNSLGLANFPANWVGQTGVETSTNASGSLTVLYPPVTQPGSILIGYSGGNLQVAWTNAGSKLQEATNIAGPWTNDVSVTSPFIIVPTEPQKFYRLSQ